MRQYPVGLPRHKFEDTNGDAFYVPFWIFWTKIIATNLSNMTEEVGNI